MEFWQGKKVLITGHTGFKGSWLSLWLQSLGVELVGFSRAPPTQPNLFEITQLRKGMVSLLGDVCDFQALQTTLKKYQPEIIIHMAAQSLVRYSYVAPLETYTTNVMGTVNILEAARLSDSVKVLINVTSDKCYENKSLNRGYHENDRLGGYDPYSNSKACSELVTQSYRSAYFEKQEIGIATVRAGNVIGGGDWAKNRLVPDIINACIERKNILLRYPHALRPWQYVLEPLYGYMMLAQALYNSPSSGSYAESWNFGPDEENVKSVSWIADYILKIWNSSMGWILDEDQCPMEASILQLDCSKAKKYLGWRPIWNIDRGLKETVDWYLAYQERQDMRDITIHQISKYVDEISNLKLDNVTQGSYQ
ncbi:MAG: CDP-glucose 4,6-dehydratase [Candidatus Aquirickettsiella gammari]|uniref:CDP-glucose 4,6-dehydratase n=1 Tax=Candidatus Aquirickettsiella gammari TaxID=2016198 RepID=A0A370CKA0_9COXI|nr:MAG: CDP-glucose 4,6-dehydratase [Candidatus Aquirickettsiella gammari]